MDAQWPKNYNYWAEFSYTAENDESDGSMDVGWWGSCDKLILTKDQTRFYDDDGNILANFTFTAQKGPYSREEQVTVTANQTSGFIITVWSIKMVLPEIDH